ncbi:predicted protein [Naegleria gruberi]|uniref:Predicted protein n=1 Tax=Naegleria gruberi TaxID=5762 RepID=D2VUH8_NAEGR|nr:uncharacterized protein NAEGRDRAFT_81273 [Naegleria gruberi]EFC39513.1 predicted protein [Naegleria gruberi]|eukprot:XP_002672257.1 predicted protein [Naegleria gruberi strain NEG-M]
MTEGSSVGSGGGGVVIVNIPSSASSDDEIRKAKNSSSRKEDENSGSSSCSLMLLTTAILFPPLAMGILLRFHLKHPMEKGEKVRQIVVCAMLTMLCYVPGLLHVIFAILQEAVGD